MSRSVSYLLPSMTIEYSSFLSPERETRSTRPSTIRFGKVKSPINQYDPRAIIAKPNEIMRGSMTQRGGDDGKLVAIALALDDRPTPTEATPNSTIIS